MYFNYRSGYLSDLSLDETETNETALYEQTGE
jgi:hypothetical protein